MKKFIPVSVILYLSSILVCGPAEAYSGIADFLTDRGKKFHKEGRFEEAVHEFSKALLADPDNPTAREYLRKLGLNDHLYDPQETSLSRIRNLARQIVILEEELSYLENHFQERVDEQQSLIKKLDVQRAILSAQLLEGRDELAALEQDSQKLFLSNQQKIKALQQHAGFLEESLARERKDLQRFREMGSLFETRNQRQEQELAQAHNRITALTGQMDRLQQEMKTKQAAGARSAAALALEKTDYEKQLNALREKIQTGEKKVGELQRALAEKNKIISDYEAKVNLTGDERNRQLKDMARLEEQLSEKKQDADRLAGIVAQKEGALAEWDRVEQSRLDEIESYRVKLAESQKAVEKKEQQIADLQKDAGRMKILDEEVAALKSQTDAQAQEIAQLTQQLAVKKEEVGSLVNILAQKEEALVERHREAAQERLLPAEPPVQQPESEKSYRARVAAYEKSLDQKEKRIAELQQQLAALQKAERTAAAAAKSSKDPSRADPAMRDELAFLRSEYRASLELLTEKQRLIDSLTLQLNRVKSGGPAVTVAQENISKDAESPSLTGLRGQLQNAKVRLLELEKTVEEKDDLIAMLQRRLSETEQRLELVQRIIQEKDERISALEKQLNTR